MRNHFRIFSIHVIVILLVIGCQAPKEETTDTKMPGEFTTPLGKVYTLNEPSEKMVAQYQKAKEDYESKPNDVDNIIWYGRRTAYLGNYDDAINIYTEGIKLFPDEPRLYRHRGHRNISLRNYDQAILDLTRAGDLIEGTENEIEPDGMPNAMNIPVSTLHGNIWYHLGLAYYLKHDYENSFMAYIKCRDSGDLPDNIVSATHWLYMIQRRMGNIARAEEMLDPIRSGTEIIENKDYYDLCRFYKGLIPMDSLIITGEDSPSSDALKYGIANWYYYNDNKDEAKPLFEDLVDGNSWSSFGYIAAESDLLKYYTNQ